MGEPVLPRGYNASQLLAEQLRQKQPPPETSESKASRQKARHEKLINDFLERDLASYLCDIDEELKAKIDALPEAERPKSEVKRKHFAEAHYANAAADREAGGGAGAGNPTTPSRTPTAAIGGGNTTTAVAEAPTE